MEFDKINYSIHTDRLFLRLFEKNDAETVKELWQQVKLDSSRTCVYWNDRIDIASDTIYEYGKPVISI